MDTAAALDRVREVAIKQFKIIKKVGEKGKLGKEVLEQVEAFVAKYKADYVDAMNRDKDLLKHASQLRAHAPDLDDWLPKSEIQENLSYWLKEEALKKDLKTKRITAEAVKETVRDAVKRPQGSLCSHPYLFPTSPAPHPRRPPTFFEHSPAFLSAPRLLAFLARRRRSCSN